MLKYTKLFKPKQAIKSTTDLYLCKLCFTFGRKYITKNLKI